MGCLPESGGCERHRTDPFVSHLNKMRAGTYVHMACLDRLYRNTPQPEALYCDQGGSELVIERKSIVWPSDYAAKHRNDHFIAEAFVGSLREMVADRPLTLHLESSARMSRRELSAFAEEISDAVKASFANILEGHQIRSTQVGRRWSCCLDPEERAESDEPETGVIVRWMSRDELISAAKLPDSLRDDMRRCFEDTINKFSGYPSAKGILLLDPYGSIRYTGADWWSEAFITVPVPSGLSEVWLAQYDWVTDTEQGWMFEQIHPVSHPSGLV